MDSFVTTFASALGFCPVLLVLIGAVVVAVARWTRHPRVSMYVVAGAIVISVTSLASRLVFSFLPRFFGELGHSQVSLAQVFTLTGLVSSVIDAIGFGLLLTAAFVDRLPSRER